MAELNHFGGLFTRSGDSVDWLIDSLDCCRPIVTLTCLLLVDNLMSSGKKVLLFKADIMYRLMFVV